MAATASIRWDCGRTSPPVTIRPLRGELCWVRRIAASLAGRRRLRWRRTQWRLRVRKLLLAAACVLALSASALAADAPVKAAPLAAPFNWTGCYLGANAGGGWAKDSDWFFGSPV